MSAYECPSDSDEDKFGGDFDLSRMLDTASKMKSAQLAKIRKEYEGSPGFIKATQVFASRNNEWRDLSVTERMTKCETLKIDGNQCFKNDDFMSALNNYSEGISLFRYFEKRDERGEHLELKDLILDGHALSAKTAAFWETPANYDKARALVIALLLNCAAASLSLRKHSDVLWCCQAVLKYDAENAKALYKMSQSHQLLDTTFDLEFALKYIARAKAIAPENSAVISKFKEIKQTLKTQRQKDRKQFNGLFDRGSIYGDKVIKKGHSEGLSISVVRRCFDCALSRCAIL